ncbi:unnamed protein product [Lactuca virosa]|uniref:Uncharacterized protein n=1 Tax=Lactuca virosa TaxID=75947 RepID=A0AAU9NIR9_9ASTR|nr:unnamed protein product [Lactuca virosa]
MTASLSISFVSQWTFGNQSNQLLAAVIALDNDAQNHLLLCYKNTLGISSPSLHQSRIKAYGFFKKK